MQVDDNKIKKFLIDSDFISRKNLEEAEKYSKKNKKKLQDVIIEKNLISSDNLKKLQAYISGIPFVNLKEIKIDPDVLKIIPEQVARQYNAIAFEKKGGNLKIAMLDPNDLQFLDFISKKINLNIIPCLTDSEGIKKALKLFQKSLKAEFGDIVGDVGIEKENGKDKMLFVKTPRKYESEKIDLKKAAEDLPVIKIIDTLLKHAILEGASDIHIEPEEKDVIIRYRIDGILRDAMTLPRVVLPSIVARIKILSNLKIDEHRLPQDGRFKVESSDYKVAFRVSIIPVFDGEKIVMRLLDESSNVLTLEQIGMRKKDLDIVTNEIKRPNGMVLVVGPTGSGKTTTLYTITKILNTPDVNISTLEDPVEYRMPRINQTQINPKINLTFAFGLRALLRQDPDIIMVGEIRDKETAELAVHAALTGHLVLSTLHTNSASGTLPRLIDMDIEPFLVSSTVNVIISQRLVRKICKYCKKEYFLDKSSYNSLSKNMNLDSIIEVLKREKIITEKHKSDEDILLGIKFSKGTGCDRCRNEGYKGRIGVFEVLKVDDKMKKLINNKANGEEIEREARKSGMTVMIEDGIIKAVQGITTIEEVIRVTKE